MNHITLSKSCRCVTIEMMLKHRIKAFIEKAANARNESGGGGSCQECPMDALVDNAEDFLNKLKEIEEEYEWKVFVKMKGDKEENWDNLEHDE